MEGSIGEKQQLAHCQQLLQSMRCRAAGCLCSQLAMLRLLRVFRITPCATVRNGLFASLSRNSEARAHSAGQVIQRTAPALDRALPGSRSV